MIIVQAWKETRQTYVFFVGRVPPFDIKMSYEKTCRKRAGLIRNPLRQPGYHSVSLYTLDPMALRPCLSTGLPIRLFSCDLL